MGTRRNLGKCRTAAPGVFIAGEGAGATSGSEGDIAMIQKGLMVGLLEVNCYLIGDEDTKEAVADWHYWVGQGHRL